MFVALRLAVRLREILDARDRSTAIMLRMRSVALGDLGYKNGKETAVLRQRSVLRVRGHIGTWPLTGRCGSRQ